MSLVLLSGSFAATWVVDPGGAGHATTIQGAVDLAADGDEIVVKAGTYGEQVELDKGLRIVGESGAAATTITAGDVRQYGVHRSPNGSTVVELEGLTFTGGNSSSGFCNTTSLVSVASPLRMIDCIVENNITHSAAVYAHWVEISGTRFTNNEATFFAGCGAIDPDHVAGALSSGSEIHAEGCLFEGNSSPDNPVADFTVAQFVGCTFRDHSGDPWVSGLFARYSLAWGSWNCRDACS